MDELVEQVAAIGAERGLEALTGLAAAGADPPAEEAPAAPGVKKTGVKIKVKKVPKVQAPPAASAAPAAPAADQPTAGDAAATKAEREKKKKELAKILRVKQPKTITAFWRSRDKYPEYFMFTPTGDAGTILRFRNGNGLEKIVGDPPDKLFDLPLYIQISREDIDRLWAERQAAFESIYESIEAAKTQLRNAHGAYKAGTGTVREVVIANQLVAEEEAKLIANRSAKRWTELIANPDTNYIDLQQKYETRKLGYDVYILKQFALDPQSMLRSMTAEEAAGFSAALRGGGLSYGVVTDNTLLGLHWPAEVKVGNTQYFTAFQAILGEVARNEQNIDLFNSILGTRSSRTLRTLTKEFNSSQYTPEILQSVITAISKQYPEFRELLLETGDDELVYANILDPIFSIGLDEEDPNIQLEKQWRGENLWGQALQTARSGFREKNVTSRPEDEGISKEDENPIENAVISKEQQDAAKKAAIINAKRFHKNH